jgi:hypothetical protein
MKYRSILLRLFAFSVTAVVMSSCGSTVLEPVSSSDTQIILEEDPATTTLDTASIGLRNNRTEVLIPVASGTLVYENKNVRLDASNSQEGYVIVEYLGDSAKVKLQITGSDDVKYTYNLRGGTEVFPLSAGTGTYTIAVFENIKSNQYTSAFSEVLPVKVNNEFGAFLYPNQYVYFSETDQTIALAKELAASADNDLDVVSNIYNYIIKNISYDYNKAETVQSGYVTVVDEILASGTGICLDYAAVMTSMLRSQRIPTRLEVGYAGEAYHAWISTYIEDIGWVNGIIEFNGTEWELMDPTFAANSSEKTLKNFIGDGSNYSTVYVY